ncbi:TPA: hypothetical protein JG914_004795 [Enterobacter hormaechei subsp. steigerwaltii]|nr:hypothetical protein [Enterobacter hormaechei subsp. steigerwaltii]
MKRQNFYHKGDPDTHPGRSAYLLAKRQDIIAGIVFSVGPKHPIFTARACDESHV